MPASVYESFISIFKISPHIILMCLPKTADGGGGKGTWGKLLDTDGESHLDRNDPNYDSGEVIAILLYLNCSCLGVRGNSMFIVSTFFFFDVHCMPLLVFIFFSLILHNILFFG